MNETTNETLDQGPDFSKGISFRDQTLFLSARPYANGKAIALRLLDERMRDFATASVYVEELPDHRVFIKDYAENEGIAEALVEAGVVTQTDEVIRSGYVDIRLYEFTPEFCAYSNLYHPSFPAPEGDDLEKPVDLSEAHQSVEAAIHNPQAAAAKLAMQKDADAIARAKALEKFNEMQEAEKETPDSADFSSPFESNDSEKNI